MAPTLMAARGIPMSRLTSRCPEPTHDAAHRTDPFWGGWWDGRSDAVWTSYTMAKRRRTKLPVDFDLNQTEALSSWTGSTRRVDRLRLLATVAEWRTVTAEQARTITGSEWVGSARLNIPATGFVSSLIDLGMYPNVLDHSSLYTNTAFYRPTSSDVFNKEIAPTLTYAEWLAVTGGRDWSQGGQFDRHNVLSTELALRMAEYTTVAMVSGERYGRADDLCGTGIGRQEVKSRAADLLAIRTDGLRIAFEVTASNATTVGDKVERWVQLLERTPMRDSGLVVVFVVAVPPDQNRIAADTWSRTCRAVEAAVAQYPGVFNDRTRNRIAVVDWSEWFPAEHEVSLEFVQGRVHVVGEVGTGDWTTACLFTGPRTPDTDLVRFTDTKNLRSAITTLGAIAGTPHWMRGNYRAFWSQFLTPTHEIPTVVSTRKLGEGWGVSGNAQPYERLLGV